MLGLNVFITFLCLFFVWDTKASKTVIEDYVDVIEHNYFYNQDGQINLDQYIFYRYSPNLGEYIVIAWRSNKEFNPPYKVGDGYVMCFRDFRDGGINRKVHAKHIRETHTYYDPENVNQELYPRDLRSDLTRKPDKPTKPK